MKIAWVCGEDDMGRCYCWGSAVVDKDECPETPAWETTVRSGVNVLGRLMFGRHIEGSGLSRKDRWALEIAARLLGMQLEVHRLRDALAAQERERGPSPLSERERDILRLVAQGKLDREIADELHLSRKTVESHLQNIYRKLGARNR
ncbi:MAG: helix-turn-helix transcriptional regulator, partial [Chloroflexi bacterium]|nr:helix-turn-helix transcriptional regulator [Chloroflexota bacterium]